jgi:hypothetical protein
VEARVQELAAGGVGLLVAAATEGDASDRELFFGRGEEACASGVVGEEEQDEEGGEDRDDALVTYQCSVPSYSIGSAGEQTGEKKRRTTYFNDEQPPEPLQATGTVDMTHAVRDGATKCTGEVTEGYYKRDADGALVVPIPDGNQIDDSCSGQHCPSTSLPFPSLHSSERAGHSHLGKTQPQTPQSKTSAPPPSRNSARLQIYLASASSHPPPTLP